MVTYTYIVKTTAYGSAYVHERTVYRASPNAEKEIARCVEANGRRDRVKVVGVELFAGLYSYISSKPETGKEA